MATTERQIKGAVFDLSEHEPETHGEYYYDPTGKGQLRAVQPEEDVRQRFVKFLASDQVGAPLDRLTTEDAVSHHRRSSSRQRMDIFCQTPRGEPLFIVECKRKDIPCDVEEHRNQVHGYAKKVGCKLAILTNGIQTYTYKQDNEGICKLDLPENTIPTYREMLNLGSYNVRIESPRLWYRPAWEDLPCSAEGLKKDGHFSVSVSSNSSKDRIRWLASLAGLFLDSGSAGSWRKSGLTVEDKGTACVSPTNASGGRWTGTYRGFLTNTPDGLFMVRFAVMPDWKGGTTLIVATDDENGKTRNQLQLDMDLPDTIELSGVTATVRHNGRLSGGKKGWTKAALVDYARRHAPRLVSGEHIVLGDIPTDRHVGWKNGRTFITNCIEYALLRKRFKDDIC